MNVNKTTLTNSIIKLVQSCTDELIATTVVVGTMAGYYVSVSIPSEPMMLVLSFYFIKKAVEIKK